MVLAAIVLVSPPAQAAPQDVANDISQQIMSPFCPGVTLHDCPSDAAIALRDRITAMAEDGFTKSEIMAELEREYGATIRAEPPKSGSGLIAWILPAVAVATAVTVASIYLRRWAKVPARTPAHNPGTQVTPEDRRRLESELDKLRGPA